MLVYDSQYITAPGVGLYRCKVVDTYTNGYVWSDIVEISDELAFVSVEKRNEWSDAARFEIAFKGGAAPYRVKIYLRTIIDSEDPSKLWEYVDTVRYTDTVYTRYDLARMIYTLDRGVTYIVKYYNDNELHSEPLPAVYKVVVYDANNNRAESSYFSAFDLNIVYD